MTWIMTAFSSGLPGSGCAFVAPWLFPLLWQVKMSAVKWQLIKEESEFLLCPHCHGALEKRKTFQSVSLAVGQSSMLLGMFTWNVISCYGSSVGYCPKRICDEKLGLIKNKSLILNVVW